jgi:hypothetical protein
MVNLFNSQERQEIVLYSILIQEENAVHLTRIQLSTLARPSAVKRPGREADHSLHLQPRFEIGEAASPLFHTSLWNSKDNFRCYVVFPD